MASVISRLSVELGLDDKKFKHGLSDASREASGLTKRLGSLNRALNQVVATAGGFIIANVIQRGASVITHSIVGIIDAGSNLAESSSKAKAVFTSNFAEIEKAATGAAFSVGLSKGEYLEAAGTLGNLLKGVGVANDQLPVMSENVIQAAADLGSFNNVDPSQVLEDLRSGLVGESEPLRKYGILINEAAVNAKGMELGLADANGELSEGAKVQARYALIMEQLGDAQGDFAKTQFGLANGLRVLRALWGNIQAWLGGKIAPTLARVTAGIQRMAMAFSDFREKGMSPFIAGVNALHKTLVNVFGQKRADSITAAILDFADSARKTFNEARILFFDFLAVAKRIGRIVLPIFGFLAKHLDIIGPAILGAVIALKAFAAAQMLVAAVSAILNLALSPLILVMIAIAAVGALFAVAWVKNWFDIRGKTAAVVGFLIGLFHKVVDFIQPVIDIVVLLGHYFHDVMTNKIQPGNLAKLPKWLQPIALVLGRIIKTLRVFFKTWQDKGFLAALKTIPTQIRAFGRAVANLLDSMGLHHFADAVKDTFYDLSRLFTHVVDLIDDLVHGRWKQVWGDLKNIAVDLFHLFIDRFKMGIALLVDLFILIPWGTIGSALWNGLSAAVGFLVTTGIPWLLAQGRALLGALLGGLQGFWNDTLAPWLLGLAGKLFAFLANDDTFNMLYGAGNFLFDALSKGISFAWDWLWGWFKGLPDRLIGVFANIYNEFYNIGWSVIAGMSAGIQSIWNTLVGWIDAIINQFNRIPDFLKPGSPSKTMTVIGKSAPWGLAVGIQKGMPMLTRAAGQMAGAFQMAGSGAATVGTPRLAAMPAVAGTAGGGSTSRSITFAPNSIVINEATNGEQIVNEIRRAIRRREAGMA